jgi:hypothetical protein
VVTFHTFSCILNPDVSLIYNEPIDDSCSLGFAGQGVDKIVANSHLVRQRIDWFGDLTITLEDNGDTHLAGPVVDRAALHGLLKKCLI